jgi:Ca2+-binding RTX toxin-like protein
VYGRESDDTIDCGLASWPLLIYGQAGNDELTGSLLGGLLDGGDGNDILHASTGPDLLTGGAGDDIYVFSDRWMIDSVSESADGGVDTLDFSAVTTDTIVTINPLSVADAGIDRLTAGSYVEVLIFGSGDDTFVFGSGARLAGGNGTIDGGGGINTLDYAAYSSEVTVDLTAGTATGTAGVVNIRDAAGGSGADTLAGDAAVNTLIGNGGDDRLEGNAGDDTLPGGDGNDTLVGGAGSDTLTGGAGNDVYAFSNGWGTDTFSETPAEGSDTLDFSPVTANLTFSATQRQRRCGPVPGGRVEHRTVNLTRRWGV